MQFLKDNLVMGAEKYRYMFFGFFIAVIIIFSYKFIASYRMELKKNNKLLANISKLFENKYLRILFSVSLPLAVEMIVFKNYRLLFNIDSYYRLFYCYGFIGMLYLFKFLSRFSDKFRAALSFIVKHRYSIALIVFALFVIFKINFSSIGMWDAYVREGKSSTLFGTPRSIRSDEWLVGSPFTLSQQYNNYSLVNDNLALGNNDMNLFRTPVIDFSLPMRVMYWGFFIFGNEMGFAWLWSFKLIALFMISFELGMMITGKDKSVSLLCAFWITFSPIIMWWSISEQFLFGIGVIVLFHTYVANPDLTLAKKILIAYAMCICLCNFAYAIYPAWQIPFAYLILAFVITDSVRYHKNLKKKDYIIMSSTLMAALAFIAYFIVTSLPSINALLSTKYPGTRDITGGDYDLKRLFNYYSNLFTPFLKFSKKFPNPSEISAVICPTISVFLIIALGAFAVIKEKRIKKYIKDSKNWYLFSVLAVISYFALWLMLPWNRILRKVTLMYFSPEIRTETIAQIAFLILIIILAGKIFNRKRPLLNKCAAFFVSVGLSVFAYFMVAKSNFSGLFTGLMFLVLVSMIFIMNYTFLSANKKAFIFTMIIICIITGATVNPVCSGTAVINETKIAKAAVSIAENDTGTIWAGETQANAQYLLANGIKVINGVNEYPNYAWIDKLDPEHKYEEVWDRYAHILISPSEGEKFELLGGDIYIMHLSYDDFKSLGIKYFYSYNKYDANVMKTYMMSCVYSDDLSGQYIYKIE
ncbi:MAG: hypothetical protein J5659_03225 [Clostridia bacterium]|nr:hypothetical protein [Clostridia bacterium]